MNRKKLSEQIYEVLKAEILAQTIPFEHKLLNRELQNRFEVSSSPVRDAINCLYQDGLIEKINKGSAEVISFNVETALEVNEMMAFLVVDALELCVRGGDQAAVVAAMEAAVQRQEQSKSAPEYLLYDKQYHQAFVDWCGNSLLKKTYERISTLFDVHLAIHHKNSENTRDEAIRQHKEILEAYRRSEFDAAGKLLRDHFIVSIQPLRLKLEGAKLSS